MKKINNLWNHLGLKHKFSLVFTLLLTLFLIVMGIIVYQTRLNYQRNQSYNTMRAHTADLYTHVETYYLVKKDQAQKTGITIRGILDQLPTDETDYSLISGLNALTNISTENTITNEDIDYLANRLSQTSYLQVGFATIIDTKGVFLVHPTEKGKNIETTKLFADLSKSNQGELSFQWPEGSSKKENHAIFYRYFQPWDIYIATVINTDDVIYKPLGAVTNLIFISLLVGVVLFYLAVRWLMLLISNPIAQTSDTLQVLSKGKEHAELNTIRVDEIGVVYRHINNLIRGLKDTAEFAREIGRKNFDHPFTPLSEDDALGNALIEMRESLKKAEEDEKLRKVEDEKRRWTTEGLAKFGEILRINNDNMEALSNNIIKNLVKYLNINQGGLFILNDSNYGEKFLELTGCYAFDRQKFLKKRIEIGEGITGTCVLEKQSIYLRNIPENYINITSGLGDASPGFLLVVPLKLNEEVHGVVELASFNEFQPHEIEFVEKIGESIASTISGVKIAERTSQLLEQSQQQSEEMKAQEEEMRQNMEEMQSTQEELQRRNEEMKKIQEDLDKESALLRALLEYSEDTIYFKDRESKFLRVSKSLLNHWSIEGQTQIMGLSDFDLTTFENAKPKYDAEQEIMRTGKPIKIEEKDITIDGSVRWISTVKMPLYDQKGNVVGTFGISRDITDFKKTLDKARENETELMSKVNEIENLKQNLEMSNNQMKLQKNTVIRILNEIPQKVYLKDKDLKFLFVNQAVADVYENKTIEDVIGTTDFDHYEKELAKTYEKSDKEVIEKGEQTFEQEDIVKGDIKIVRSNKKPFYIDYLDQTGLLGIQTDITEIVKFRELEKENHKLKSELDKLKGKKT